MRLRETITGGVLAADAIDTRHTAGLRIADPTFRRLIEGATTSLNLAPRHLSDADLQTDALFGCELVIADEAEASRLRAVLGARPTLDAGVEPTLVAIVRSAEERQRAEAAEAGFGGVLLLPEKPALLTAQLSVILYAARAFSLRYRSALEELRLNRRIFQSVTSGISIADATAPDMPLLYVNPGFEIMTGYCLEEVQGRNCRFLQNGVHKQPGLDHVRDALREKRECVSLLKNFRKDGSAFWNELYLSPILNREGELTHFVGIQMDVTERVELESALRASEKLAAVGRLASSIAHEINNPLAAVMNLLYLAQSTPERDEVQRFLGQADHELRRVKLITSQSLRFYKQSTKPQAVQAGELLDSVLDLYGSRLRNFSVRIERRDRNTISVVCLESEIRQVLTNLFSNALDAMKGPGGRLLVRSREGRDWRSGERGLVFTVADTGTGMSRDTLDNMYEAFFTTKEAAGTGLGLWISSEIVARHRGQLRVRSSQHHGRSGSVFQLFLPYAGVSRD